MKRVLSRSFPIACLLVSGLCLSAIAQAPAPAPVAPAPATAADAAPAGTATAPTGATKVAVINFTAAVFQTNEGKRNIGELQKKFDPKRAQLKAQSDEIDTLKKQLQASGDKLSDAERQNRTRTIDEKEKALQRDGEDASNDYEQEMQQTYQQVAEKVFAVVQSYASQNGFGVVLDQSAGPQQQLPTVLWASQGTDITKAIIDAYNVKSGVPAPPAEAPAPHTPAPGSRAPAIPAHPSGTTSH